MHPVPSALRAASRHQLAHRDRRAAMPKVAFIAPDLERDGDYWQNRAQDVLRRQLQKNTLNKNVAKNIILFLGDGMSIPTLSAARIYMGGEEKELSFEAFPFSGLSKVRVIRSQYALQNCVPVISARGERGVSEKAKATQPHFQHKAPVAQILIIINRFTKIYMIGTIFASLALRSPPLLISSAEYSPDPSADASPINAAPI